MTASINTSGNATAVVGTAQTLATITAAGTYQLAVDVSNMAAGDVLVLNIYARVNASGAAISTSSPLAYPVTLSNAQVITLALSPPIMTPLGSLFELKQTAGTARTYQWAVWST
jgi:hypothetical protein